jgi:hypothetical protein
LRRATFASNDLLAGEVEDLDLFLLPNGQPGRHFTGADEEETSMVAALDLFLLPRGRLRPRFSTTIPASRSTTLVSAMEIFWWIGKHDCRKNLTNLGKKMMRREDQ